MEKTYPTIEYHEGLYSDFLILHAWNSIVKEGERKYFDFTGYFLEKSRKIERFGDMKWLFETIMEYQSEHLELTKVDYSFDFKLVDQNNYIDELNRK